MSGGAIGLLILLFTVLFHFLPYRKVVVEFYHNEDYLPVEGQTRKSFHSNAFSIQKIRIQKILIIRRVLK